MDQNSINLLDLPNELLFIIFEYTKNLKSLLLVNRTLNELITQSSFLMKHLILMLEYNESDVIPGSSLNALVTGNREYQNLKVIGKHL